MIYCTSYEKLKKVCYNLRNKGINTFKVIKTKDKQEYTVIYRYC